MPLRSKFAKSITNFSTSLTMRCFLVSKMSTICADVSTSQCFKHVDTLVFESNTHCACAIPNMKVTLNISKEKSLIVQLSLLSQLDSVFLRSAQSGPFSQTLSQKYLSCFHISGILIFLKRSKLGCDIRDR